MLRTPGSPAQSSSSSEPSTPELRRGASALSLSERGSDAGSAATPLRRGLFSPRTPGSVYSVSSSSIDSSLSTSQKSSVTPLLNATFYNLVQKLVSLTDSLTKEDEEGVEKLYETLAQSGYNINQEKLEEIKGVLEVARYRVDKKDQKEVEKLYESLSDSRYEVNQEKAEEIKRVFSVLNKYIDKKKQENVRNLHGALVTLSHSEYQINKNTVSEIKTIIYLLEKCLSKTDIASRKILEVLLLFIHKPFHFSKHVQKILSNIADIFKDYLNSKQPLALTSKGLKLFVVPDKYEEFKIFFEVLGLGETQHGDILIRHNEMCNFLQALGYPEQHTYAAIAQLYQSYNSENISGMAKYQWACFEENYVNDPAIYESHIKFFNEEIKRLQNKIEEGNIELSKMISESLFQVNSAISLHKKAYALYVLLEHSKPHQELFLRWSTVLGFQESEQDIENTLKQFFIQLAFSKLSQISLSLELNQHGFTISGLGETAQTIMQYLSERGLSIAFYNGALIIPHFNMQELLYLAHYSNTKILSDLQEWYEELGLDFSAEVHESAQMARVFTHIKIPFFSYELKETGLNIYTGGSISQLEEEFQQLGIIFIERRDYLTVRHHSVEELFSASGVNAKDNFFYLKGWYERLGFSFEKLVIDSLLVDVETERADVKMMEFNIVPKMHLFSGRRTYILRVDSQYISKKPECPRLIGIANNLNQLQTQYYFLPERTGKNSAYFRVQLAENEAEPWFVVCYQDGKFSIATLTLEMPELFPSTELEKNTLWVNYFKTQISAVEAIANPIQALERASRLRLMLGDEVDPISRKLKSSINDCLGKQNLSCVKEGEYFPAENVYVLLANEFSRKIGSRRADNLDQNNWNLRTFDPAELRYYIYFDLEKDECVIEFHRDSYEVFNIVAKAEEYHLEAWVLNGKRLSTSNASKVVHFFEQYLDKSNKLDLLQRLLMTSLSRLLKLPPIAWPRAYCKLKEGKILFYFNEELAFPNLSLFMQYLNSQNIVLPSLIQKLLADVHRKQVETIIEQIRKNHYQWVRQHHFVQEGKLMIELSPGEDFESLEIEIDEYSSAAIIAYLKEIWGFREKLEFDCEKNIISVSIAEKLNQFEEACFEFLPPDQQAKLTIFNFSSCSIAYERGEFDYLDSVSFIAMRIGRLCNTRGQLTFLDAQLGLNLPQISLVPNFKELKYQWEITFASNIYAQALQKYLKTPQSELSNPLILNYTEMQELLTTLGISLGKMQKFYEAFQIDPSAFKRSLEIEGIGAVELDARMLLIAPKVIQELKIQGLFFSASEPANNFSDLLKKIAKLEISSRHRLMEGASVDAQLVLLTIGKILLFQEKQKMAVNRARKILNELYDDIAQLAGRYPKSVKTDIFQALLPSKGLSDEQLLSAMCVFKEKLTTGKNEAAQLFAPEHSFFGNKREREFTDFFSKTQQKLGCLNLTFRLFS